MLPLDSAASTRTHSAPDDALPSTLDNWDYTRSRNNFSSELQRVEHSPGAGEGVKKLQAERLKASASSPHAWGNSLLHLNP
jgi:hypothetical protein